MSENTLGKPPTKPVININDVELPPRPAAFAAKGHVGHVEDARDYREGE